RRMTIVAACVCGGASAQTASPPPTQQPSRVVSEPLRNLRVFYESGVWLEEPKIIGGVRSQPGQNPWQVALLDGLAPEPSRDPFCGGSLIGSQWVVTAAHSVDQGTRPTDVDVLGGTSNYLTGGTRVH